MSCKGIGLRTQALTVSQDKHASRSQEGHCGGCCEVGNAKWEHAYDICAGINMQMRHKCLWVLSLNFSDLTGNKRKEKKLEEHRCY
jgi:hypothetical protein